MIFTRSCTTVDLSRPLILSKTVIERKHEARFLGVIINELLTWSRHIKPILSKMSGYVGIMYKIKRYLPIKAQLEIFQSFVQ